MPKIGQKVKIVNDYHSEFTGQDVGSLRDSIGVIIGFLEDDPSFLWIEVENNPYLYYYTEIQAI